MLNVTILTALLNLFAPAAPVATDNSTTATNQTIGAPQPQAQLEPNVRI